MMEKKFHSFFELFSFTFENFRFYIEKITGNSLKLENHLDIIKEDLLNSFILSSEYNETRNFAFNISLNDFSLIAEFFLAFTALITITYCSLIVYSEFYKKRSLIQFSGTSISILILFFTFMLLSKDELVVTKHLSMDFSFLNDSLGNFAKIVTVILSLICVYLTKNSLTRNKINYNEYDLLILYAILGLLLITTANDLTTIFLTLELQGLSIYILSGIKRNSMYSIDSGLKYIFVASLSTGYYLLGSGLLFGLSGLLLLVGFHFFLNDIFKIDAAIFSLSLEELTEVVILVNKLIPNSIEKSHKRFEQCGTTFSGCEIVSTLKAVCCCSCESHNKDPLLDDVILDYYNKNKVKINAAEFNSITCESCKELLIVFNVIDMKSVTEEEKKTLRKQFEKIIYKEPKYKPKKKCWFCQLLFDGYCKQIAEEKQKKEIIYVKRMRIYEKTLPDEVFAKYYNYLKQYFKTRDHMITREAQERAVSEAFFQACDTADNYKDEFFIYPCRYIEKRFKTAWQTEYIKNTLLTKKIEQACRNSKDKKQIPSQLCQALEKSYKDICKITTPQKNELNFQEQAKKEKRIQNILLWNSFDNNSFFVALSSSLNFILISFFFKLAGAPFHLWSLDIYEGSPTSSTIFFAVVTKFSIIVVLAKICYYGFYSALKKVLYQYIIFISILSTFVGAIAGLREQKLKSLLAYSSINNVGYLLLTLTIGTLNSIKATFFYLIIYISSSLATWSSLVSIQIKKNRYVKKQNKDFADLTLIRKNNPMLTLFLHMALFSTAGLPPFIGFLTKMNVFLVSIESHVFLISLITILLSIVSSFYYLRLIKVTCFEKILIGKLHQTVKLNQSSINNFFGFFLPYLFVKPSLSILFSYKVIIC